MNKTEIKLMPDYYCYPLWGDLDDGYNLSPDDFPLTESLKNDLNEWAEVYDGILN